MFGYWIKTFALMAAITALFMAVGGALGGESGMVMALLLAGAMNFYAYWFSDKAVLKMYGAVEINPENNYGNGQFRSLGNVIAYINGQLQAAGLHALAGDQLVGELAHEPLGLPLRLRLDVLVEVAGAHVAAGVGVVLADAGLVGGVTDPPVGAGVAAGERLVELPLQGDEAGGLTDPCHHFPPLAEPTP